MSLVNESTSVIRVDSSGLQGGAAAIVYISTTTIPEQLVTVIDATGYTSSPQTILLSTTGGAMFSDGTSSTSISQRFGYITLVSQGLSEWSIVNRAAFSNPVAPALYKSLDAGTVNTYTAQTTGLVSTGTAAIRGVTAASSLMGTRTLYTSTLYINTVSSFLASRPNDYLTTLIGNELIGPLSVTGRSSYRGNISTLGDMYNVGSISSKAGTIYVQGNVTTQGSIRGQRGIQMTVNFLSTYVSSQFLGPVSMSSVTAARVTARAISTQESAGTAMNVASSIIFSDGYQSLVNTPRGLSIVGLGATVPSSISTTVLSANSIQTSNLYINEFGSLSSLAYLTLASTAVTNPNGSLVVSSIQGNSATIRQSVTARSAKYKFATTQGIQLNDANPGGNMSIHFGPSTYDLSGYWMISSLGTNGTLNAPYTTLSTMTMLTHAGSAVELDTNSDTITQFTTGSITVGASIIMTGVNTLSMKNVFMNNSSGSIQGSVSETIQDIHCSSIVTDFLSTGTAMRFVRPVAASLKDTFISTVNSATIKTSSLRTSFITTGSEILYSTINPSTPYLLTSSFQMNTGPFMTATGLGSFIEEATFIASSNETTYYSIINPVAQTSIYLSTPYVNSIAGTGTPGAVINGQVATRAQLGSALSQAAADTDSVFVGSKDLGWKIQQISSGTITTIAGGYRYFYGDGLPPIQAALGPQLAVSVSPQGQVVITDISNVRIRTYTTDPIMETIAGTGASRYSGDTGLAYLATLSTPTGTAVDASGTIYVADTLNQVLRKITGSTISLLAGTPGIPGNSGDEGPAISATLSRPFGLTLDPSRNLYFTDLSNSVIRSVDTAGVIHRVAGTYSSGFSGDGGLATLAALSTPRAITLDAQSNIYFCDTGNARVRKITAATQVIQTIAGNGTSAYAGDGGLAVNASLSTPTGVAVDAIGNIYISDTDNQCIRYINVSNNRITTIAGQPRRAGYGGDYSFAKNALLNSPSHVAYDVNTNYLYIADDQNARIRYIDLTAAIINSAAGNGSPISWGDGGNASNAIFGSIASLVRGKGNTLYIVDDAAHRIRAIDLGTRIISAVAGTGVAGFSGEGGNATVANLSSPQQLVVDSRSNIYFTDRDNQRIRKITGGVISTVAGTGIPGYTGDSTLATTAQLNVPTSLAIDSADTLYVVDLNNSRIRNITSTNMIYTYAGSGVYGDPIVGQPFASTTLAATMGIAVDSNRQVYFTDTTTNAIWKLNTVTNRVERMNTATTGAFLGDAGPLSNAQFNLPNGLAVDRANNLLISDQGNSRLRRTYTFGFPQTPVYITMNFAYTNYFASTGTATVALNGNVLKTFSGSNLSNDTFSVNDLNIYTYPLLGVNPVYGDQTPYVEVTQTDSYGYTKLNGTLFAQQVPSQGLLQNLVNSSNGIQMNSGYLTFPSAVNGITIDNRYNDLSTRSVFYSGQLMSASDPALKEEIESANAEICVSTFRQIPLKRYRYVEPYLSTFRVQDTHRLGVLTTDIEPLFPKSLRPMDLEQPWASTVNSLDSAQIRLSHYGVTQHLLGLVSTLEAEVAALTTAQRNSLLS
jgi:sugar lactone lactonase YvrE